MDRILGVGNALVDALYRVEDESSLHRFALKRGGMTLIDGDALADIASAMEGTTKSRTTGGSACNTILALARLGASVGVVGKINKGDENGRFFEQQFREAGVETFLIDHALPTGVASTFITPDGERTFATCLGAAATLEAEEFDANLLADYSYLYIEGYLVQNHALMRHLISAAKRQGLKVCIDLASYNVVEDNRDFFLQTLKDIDIVFANEEEARALTRCEVDEAVDVLASMCPLAVVKVGAEGALARCGEEMVRVPCGDAATVVDKTAAGDYFAAGFLYAHSLRLPLSTCLEVGTILANEIVQVVGTRLDDDRWTRVRRKVAGL